MATLTLNANMIVSPDTQNCLWGTVLTDLTTVSGRFWIEAATVCVLSMTE